MALANLTDTAHAATALGTSLERQLGTEDVRVTNVEIPPASGMSNETLLCDATWRRDGVEETRALVARVAPAGPAVFPRYDLALEARVLQALHRETAVPVPPVLMYEGDASLLGAPFMVMERVTGRVPADDPPFSVAGWVTELSPHQRARLVDNGLTAMATLHAVDWRAVGLADLATHPEAGLDGQIAFWKDTFAWASEGAPNPVVEAGFDWLEANRPNDDGPQVLTWGDARLGNILYGAEESVAALLDWEMVSINNPEADLAWWIFMFDHFTEGIGVPAPDGFPSREEVVARYEQLSGHAVRDLEHYEILAAVRVSVLMHRAANLMIAYGQIPPDSTMALNNPASQLLAKRIGAHSPAGGTSSFIGNR